MIHFRFTLARQVEGSKYSDLSNWSVKIMRVGMKWMLLIKTYGGHKHLG